MTLFLSAREAYRQQQNTTPASEATKINSHNTGYQAVLDDPKQQSRGYENVIAFPTGINLLVSQFDLAEDLILETNFYNLPFMAFSFVIANSGESEIIPVGHNCTATYFDFDEGIPGNGVYLRADQHILHVEVGINPQQFFCRHEVSGLDLLPKSLQLYLETDNISFLNYFRIGQTTPEMQIILHQIVSCPFHGLIKDIYLQAKCLELMALKLEPDTAGERELMRSRILRTDDINQIYHAREILIRDFDNPPSLLELARQVGLNDYKLKIGFRQVFNTTVFGYLYAHRMEKARKLLMSQQMTIKQIAKIVGYVCPSRFAVAFKKRFGIQPSQYLDRFIVAKNT
ncbi:helix-turn-helix transcriptional regulator [Nostoc sp.]|uniref:helix-turn-helix transcriptional regulator n=1 Tax=Nostoc sp. TaxID=1180 RepID=UPI002FFA947C